MTVIETAALPARRLEWELAETREIRLETYRVIPFPYQIDLAM